MIIKNGNVFHAEGAFVKEDLCIADGKIAAACEDGEVLDAEGLYVIPGLTDIHFHACVGADFCDGKQESLQKIADYEFSQGITQICPASMTFSEEKLTEVFTAARNFPNESGAVLVGINMEGPFISKAKKGAQNEAYIHRPDADMFRRLQEAAGGLIKLCDIAPEVDGAMECIRSIHDEVTVSLAHTAADYQTAKQAFDEGACHVTHLYNAMMPYTHRAPGPIGAACDDERVMVELICDNVHIDPAAVRTTFKMFGDDRICMISDTMEACGLEDGEYALGGQKVYVKGPLATLADGTIAGSATNLMNCLRTAVKVMNIPLESAVKCCTVNPSKAIGIYDRYGSLEEGKIANVVLLDKDLNLVKVIRG